MKPRQFSIARQHLGVTLMELLIVVVIIGIIAAFAVPNYFSQVQRTGRTDATTALLAIAAEQEKEYMKNNTFAGTLAELGIETTDAGKYELTLELANEGDEFVAKATPVDGLSQASDEKCKEFSIDHTGAKRSIGDDGTGTDVATKGCW